MAVGSVWYIIIIIYFESLQVDMRDIKPGFDQSDRSIFKTGVGGCSDPPGWMDPRSIHPRVFGPGGPSTLG